MSEEQSPKTPQPQEKPDKEPETLPPPEKPKPREPRLISEMYIPPRDNEEEP